MTHILFFVIILFIFSFQCVNAENFFHFDRPKLALELSYKYAQETRTGQNTSSKDTTNEFTERIRIETDGWVYHPALLDYKLVLEPGWSQTTEDHSDSTGSESGSNNTNAYMLSYQVDASVFKFKPYTLRFFARKQNKEVTSSFTERSNTETESYGANLSLKYRILPITFGYIHNESKQTGFYNSRSNSDEIRLKTKLQREMNRTELNVSHVDKTQSTNNNDTNVETLNSGITNQLDFSKEKRRNLQSAILYRRTKGTRINSTGITFNQKLSWEHTEALDSNYRAKYSKNEWDDYESEKKSLGAGLSYKIFDNLSTNLNSEVSDSKSQGGSEQAYEGGIGFDYKQDTSIGSFRLITDDKYKVRMRDVIDEDLRSINEPHTLSTNELAFLNQRNIDVNSIVVTNADSTIIYIENIDYTITEIPPYLRISRNPLGAISNGENVLISYQYQNPAAFDDAVFSQSYRLIYTPIKSLSFLYGYSQSEQYYRGGTEPDSLEKQIDQTGEAIWDIDWSKTRLQYHDSYKKSGGSYTRWVAEESLKYRPSRNLFSTLSGSYGKNKFKETGENETFYTVSLHIDYTPTRWSTFNVKGFRNNVSGNSVDTLDHGFSIGFNMYYGVWNGSIEYMLITQEDRISDESREYYYITFKIFRKLW